MHKKGWLPARRQYDQAYISKHTAHDKLGLFYGKIKANYLYRGFSLMNCRQPRFLVLSAEYPGFPTTGQTNYFPGRVLIFFAFDILISHAKIYLSTRVWEKHSFSHFCFSTCLPCPQKRV